MPIYSGGVLFLPWTIIIGTVVVLVLSMLQPSGYVLIIIKPS